MVVGSKRVLKRILHHWSTDKSMKFVWNLLEIKRVEKQLLQIAADTFLLVFSYFTAMALRLEGFAFVSNAHSWAGALVILPSAILIFQRWGLYRTVVRYASFKVFDVIAFGVLLSALALFATGQVFDLQVPRSVPAIYFLLAFTSISGLRFLVKASIERQNLVEKKNVLIYGAGESGRQLLNALRQNSDYAVVCFVDDNRELQGQEVSGVSVYRPSELTKLKRRYKLHAILLAIPSADRTTRRTIVERLARLGVEVRTIPGLVDMVSGRAEVDDLRDVRVEDLLGRDSIPPKKDLLQRNVSNRVVFVSGAGGSIGSELCRQILRQQPKIIVLFDVSEFALYAIEQELNATAIGLSVDVKIFPLIGSVQNAGRLTTILRRLSVDTVYHAAAYKHVPLVEQNVVEGLRNNVFGTKTILEASLASGVKHFTLISTDKAVRPTNIMGASKRIAELICQNAAHMQSEMIISMVRFGNVLGSSGSVIPVFRKQIAKGGPVTVTHPEITRFFMTIPEAAQLVIQASAMAEGGDVFVLDMGEPVKIVDLAARMIRLHGLQPYFPENPEFGKQSGDIAIIFSGLRKGEKLYEELLIGNNPVGTSHPRIFAANETRMSNESLITLLDGLFASCIDHDVHRIHRLLLDAQIEFNPVSGISDAVSGVSD